MTGSPRAGFSLVELTLAIGVAAFCLLAIVGLLPIAQTSHQAASEQTVANDLASEIASDLRATRKTTPPSLQNSPQFHLVVGQAGAGSSMQTLFFREGADVLGPVGTSASGTNPAPRYRATVFLAPPATGRTATMGRILISWPAMADADPNRSPANYSGSFEMSFALDRN